MSLTRVEGEEEEEEEAALSPWVEHSHPRIYGVPYTTGPLIRKELQLRAPS